MLFNTRSTDTYCVFVCVRPPQTFQQWISPLLGLCSRELFGGPRKFFFTLHDNFAWQKKGEIFFSVVAWFARDSRYRRTRRAQYLGRGTHLGEPKKEGRHRWVGWAYDADVAGQHHVPPRREFPPGPGQSLLQRVRIHIIKRYVMSVVSQPVCRCFGWELG